MNKAVGASLVVAVTVAALALAGCEWKGGTSRPDGVTAHEVRPDDTRAATAGALATVAARPIQAPGPDALTLQRLESFAFSAFVVPVLDDGDVTRLVDPHLAPLCGEDTQVRVDGRPLVVGEPVPAGAFELMWDMRMFCPFGPDGLALDGQVRVLVFRDDEHGMEALVLPQRLTVSDEQGAATLTAQSSHWVSTQWRASQGARVREQ